MDCPYCGKQMQRGEILSDPRMRISWIPENRFNKSFMDKLWSADMHRLKNVTYRSGAWIPGNYCSSCKKLIIDTEIT